MFFLLQIVGLIILLVGVIASTAVAVVWVKRQTHIKMTPGQLAQDRVKVATAETQISEEMVKQEYHRFMHDRVLDARTTGNLRDALEGKEGDPLLLKSLVEGSPSPVKHQSKRPMPPFAVLVNGPGSGKTNTPTEDTNPFSGVVAQGTGHPGDTHEKKHLAPAAQVLLLNEYGRPAHSARYYHTSKPLKPGEMYQWRRDG